MLPDQAARFAADLDGAFVIYINGMRLNRLRALPQYLLAGRKIARMLDRLADDPESGFLGYLPAVMGLRSGAAIQYWRSLEDLARFARDPDDLHVPAWTWYEDAVAPGGGVGFWAELFVVDAADHECFYRNLPPLGLGRFAGTVPAADDRRPLGPASGRVAAPDGRGEGA